MANPSDQKTARIRSLNDALRCRGRGVRIMMTAGIEALGSKKIARVLAAIATFDEFRDDNDPYGRISDHIELHDNAAKKRSGRTIPLHPTLRRELQRLRRHTGAEGSVIRSERGGPRGMRPGSIVNWFRQLYRELGLNGCSSH